jgi:SAM-dependent methyltransferase
MRLIRSILFQVPAIKRVRQVRDALIQEQAQLIQERDSLLQEQAQLIQERDSLLQERDNLLQEQNRLKQERDFLIEFKQSGVSLKISENDEMYVSSNPKHYFSVGKSALSIIEKSLSFRVQGANNISRILDMPCGHGRVTRILKARFPGAGLTVCDLNRDGVDFCVEEFGACGVYSSNNFSEVEFENSFDLIWVGSLITHFNSNQTRNFLTFITKYLDSDGVLILTSHGTFVAKRILHNHYGLLEHDVSSVLAGYFSVGYGYADYPNSSNYGISIISRTWLDTFFQGTNFIISEHYEQLWDNHQDVFIVRRHS